MDIKNVAIQLMALKTRAEMADKQGDEQQKRELLEQMRALVKQVMDSEDPGRFVLLVAAYGMLHQETFNTNINQATEYAYECLEYALPLVDEEDSEKATTMLMSCFMNVLMCLKRQYDITQSQKYITALYPIADMFEQIINDLTAINPSGMPSLRGQGILQTLRSNDLLGHSNAKYRDLNSGNNFNYLRSLY